MWKKFLLILNVIVIALLVFVIYQQNQLIKDYRSAIYGNLTLLNMPVERVLTYHENKEYTEDSNQRVLNILYEYYGEIFNNSAWGLQHENDIRENYYNIYQDTRISYSHEIQKYIEAKTEDERQKAYDALKTRYGNYIEFLEQARKELDVE